ncbi:HAUS6 protein, partial [Chionis minor]|nr:HAUS6 protein [Chionis minor]
LPKVRSMWTLVMEILTSLKKEKEIVDHVLEGFDGCYVLDGANVVSRVPRMLACRVESNEHKHWRGNLYEAGKLNFLAVIQLLNEALRMLRDELHQYDLTSQIRYMKNISVFCTRELRNMQESRLKLREQYLAQRRGSFSRKQEDWQEKWTSFLGMCPLKLMLQWDPVSSVRFI